VDPPWLGREHRATPDDIVATRVSDLQRYRELDRPKMQDLHWNVKIAAAASSWGLENRSAAVAAAT
jgi:hypothetical protein